jgi:hypothetical protein
MNPIAYARRIDKPHPAMIFCTPREHALAAEVAKVMECWNPKRATTRQEDFLLKRLHRTRKLFGFLRRHRHELFDAAFQEELESMCRNTGAGGIRSHRRCWQWWFFSRATSAPRTRSGLRRGAAPHEEDGAGGQRAERDLISAPSHRSYFFFPLAFASPRSPAT